MTARSIPSHDFVDCAALYKEAMQNGDPTRLCPPSVRRSAAVGDIASLALRHPQLDDAPQLLYAAITHRHNDHITATAIDIQRISHSPHHSHPAIDATVQQLCAVQDGDTIECQTRHIGWLVDRTTVRERLSWGERRRSALEEARERERREREFEAACGECTFERGGAVLVDAAVLEQEERQRREEQRQGKGQIKRNKIAKDEAKDDAFEYEV